MLAPLKKLRLRTFCKAPAMARVRAVMYPPYAQLLGLIRDSDSESLVLDYKQSEALRNDDKKKMS